MSPTLHWCWFVFVVLAVIAAGDEIDRLLDAVVGYLDAKAGCR